MNGSTWTRPGTDRRSPPIPAREGEAAFAASGTCLVARGKNELYLVSGGNAARVFASKDRGETWSVTETPVASGTAGSGIFSIAMLNEKDGLVVGGNYEKPEETGRNLAYTKNGGGVWAARPGLSGYRSAVAYVDGQMVLAVGTNGADVSYDRGQTWSKLGNENLNTVAAKGKKAVWAVGPNGTVLKLNYP
jgi:photosystem II stability/assembly factor-like uncharacterized protein